MDQHVILAAVVLIVVLFIFMWYVMKSNEVSTSNYTGYMHNLTEDHQYVRNPSMYPTPANNTHREKFGFINESDNDKIMNNTYSGQPINQRLPINQSLHNW
jgi:hypothetical protein